MGETESVSAAIADECAAIFVRLAALGLEERVEAINQIRERLKPYSPFAGEPVDCVEWVPADAVEANTYNPNRVAPPEMKLLELSIAQDGFTQPIVTHADDGRFVVVDGFHRNRVGKESAPVRARVHGYLPVVRIKAAQGNIDDRMASTIRHNRARGKHQVDAMTDIVVALGKRNWTDSRIGRELGMEPDEVLRFKQIGGLAELFANHEFSEAWDIDEARA